MEKNQTAKKTKGSKPAAQIQGIPNDLRAVGNKLVTSLGSGKAALEHSLTLLDAMVRHGDTEVYVSVMERAKAKGDDNAVTILRKMLKAVWPEGKFAKATPREVKVGKNQKAKPQKDRTVFKIKGCKPDLGVLETIRKCVKEGASLRGSVIRKAITPEKDEPTKEEYLEKLDKAVDRIVDNSELTLSAIIAHLQFVQKEQAEKERLAEIEKKNLKS